MRNKYSWLIQLSVIGGLVWIVFRYQELFLFLGNEDWIVFGTIGALLVNLVYVYLTHRMLLRMEADSEPDVNVSFEVGRGLVMVVQNSGGSVAKNVSFEVVEDVNCIRSLQENGQAGISSMPLVGRGLSFLLPKQSLKFLAGSRLGDGDRSTLKFEVTYTSASGKKFRSHVEVNLRDLDGVLYDSFRTDGMLISNEIQHVGSRIVQSLNPGHGVHMHHLRRCPSCKEEVQPGARKCPACHEWVDASGGSRKPILLAVTAGAILCVALLRRKRRR